MHLGADCFPPFTSLPHSVRLSTPPAFAKAIRGSGAVRDGLRYQQHIHEKMDQLYGWQYLPDLWFSFLLDSGEFLASPDGIVVDLLAGRIFILEVKRTHTSVAFRQLRNKYYPILREALSEQRALSSAPPCGGRGAADALAGGSAAPWQFFLIEIAPHYDPADSGGECVRVIRQLADAQPSTAGVNVWPIARKKRYF